MGNKLISSSFCEYNILSVCVSLCKNKFVRKLADVILEHRVGYQPGAREPGSHEIFRLTRNFCRNSRCFCMNLTSRYFRISCQMKEFFLSHTICRKYFLVRGRNILALQVINCPRKKFLVTERSLYSRSRAEISCQRRNFLLQEEISRHRKKCLVIGRNFL